MASAITNLTPALYPDRSFWSKFINGDRFPCSPNRDRVTGSVIVGRPFISQLALKKARDVWTKSTVIWSSNDK